MKQRHVFLLVSCLGAMLLFQTPLLVVASGAAPKESTNTSIENPPKLSPEAPAEPSPKPSDAPEKNAPVSDSGSVESLEGLQREVQSSVNEMLSITGSVISGVSEGMRTGAQQIQAQLDGADGTRLIADKKELLELLDVSVLRVEEMDGGVWRITMAFRNTHEFPVRLVNLTGKQAVLLLDAAGFAHEPLRNAEQGRTVTVAARAAVKASFDFSELEAKPKQIRFFDADFSVQ